MVGGSLKVLVVLGFDEYVYYWMFVMDQVFIGNFKIDDFDGNGIVCEGDGLCLGYLVIKYLFWFIVFGGVGVFYYVEMFILWNWWWCVWGEGVLESVHYFFSVQFYVCLFMVDGDKVILEVFNCFGE